MVSTVTLFDDTYHVHLRYIVSMSPIRVVHCCEHNILIPHFQCGHEHVCSIKRVHEIRWEGCSLLLLAYRQCIVI
jgi:hypothetical protein